MWNVAGRNGVASLWELTKKLTYLRQSASNKPNLAMEIDLERIISRLF